MGAIDAIGPSKNLDSIGLIMVTDYLAVASLAVIKPKPAVIATNAA